MEKAKRRVGEFVEVGEVGGVFLSKRAYKYMNMVGKGGFGKVWKV